MKKTNKKGFTIVELVIVIAVIAILAAVLIPTFSGVVEKANVNAAKSAARNCYTELLADTNADITKIDDTTVLTTERRAAILTETGITTATLSTTDKTVTFVTTTGYTVVFNYNTSVWAEPTKAAANNNG